MSTINIQILYKYSDYSTGEIGDRGNRGQTARGPKGMPGPPGLPGQHQLDAIAQWKTVLTSVLTTLFRTLAKLHIIAVI